MTDYMELKPLAIGTHTDFVCCQNTDCNKCDWDCGYVKTMRRLGKVIK